MASNNARAELVSWKEIASYLGISVKTAQVWERDRSLPIRRLPGGRARVLAYTDELDAWKGAHTEPNPPLSLLASSAPIITVRATRTRTLWWSAFAAIAAALLIAGVAVARFEVFHPGVPSSCRIEEHALVVLGADGREVWRRAFPEGLRVDRYTPTALQESPRSWFGDLGDGQPVMLFIGQPRDWSAGATLYCFDARGRERWRFEPGKPLRNVAGEQFVNMYGIDAFTVARLGPKGALRIVLTSFHYLYYPSQVVLLDQDGTVVREYWHTGHLGHLAVGDPGRTGRNRIYLGGINNARHAATLVVLDPDTFGGASDEEDPTYQLAGFERGRELARVLLPRSDVNERMERYNGVAHLWLHPDSITVDVHERYGLPRTPNILYELSPALQVRHVTLGDAFLDQHAQLNKTGDVDHEFTSAELRALHHLQVLGLQTSAVAP